MKGLREFLCLEPDELHARGLCSFGGGSSGSTNTIQKSDPWEGQMPGLKELYGRAQNLIQSPEGAPQYFPDNTYAGLTDQQRGLMGQLINYGSAGGGPALQGANANLASTLSPGYTSGTSGAFNQGQGTLSNMLSPDYLNPWNSPSFNTVVGNTLAKAIPAATSSFTHGNRSDSGLATRAATMAATDSVGQLAQNQYQANQAFQAAAEKQASDNFLAQQGNQLKGAALAPMIDQATSGNYGTALQTAGATQTDLQNQIQAAMSRFNYGQMLPWNALGLFGNVMSGAGSPGGTTSTQQPYFSNPTANVMSGLGAAGTLASLASAGAQAAGYSGLISGGSSLLAALPAMFSDRRLKEDIYKIGESDSGFPLYTFRYKGEPKMAMHIGLMAQDVEKKRPQAVLHTPGGVKMVDYLQALA